MLAALGALGGYALTAAAWKILPAVAPVSIPRLAAAQALGVLGRADRALPVLIAAMNDPQESVRIQAVAGLESIGAADMVTMQTLRAARNDTSEYVKRISERSLEKLQSKNRR